MNAMEDPAALVGRLRATVRSRATRPLAWRIEQLTLPGAGEALG
jgi:hypothetical protein